MIIAEKNGIIAKFSEKSWKLCSKGWTEVKKDASVVPPEVDALLKAKAIKQPEVIAPIEVVATPVVKEVKPNKLASPSEMSRPDMIAELISKGVAVDKRWNNNTLRDRINDIRK